MANTAPDDMEVNLARAGLGTMNAGPIADYLSALGTNLDAEVAAPGATGITDPGNAGAIPVTASGFCPIVTAGAETRTIAAPTITGQELWLLFKTDGGDCVITVATFINQAGNNTITLNDAGDAVLLKAKLNGNNKRWSVVVNDGAALSTV